MDWYNTLNKPFLTPQNDIFTPVWVILYILIGISFILYARNGVSSDKIKGFVCYFVQLVLNFSWGGVFFGMKNISIALIIACLMWIFSFFTIIFFYKHSKISAFLLIPYIIWISFAIYLNFGFLLLN